MVKTHTLVIVSVTSWLEMLGLSVGFDGSWLIRWVKLQDIGLSLRFIIYSVLMCMLAIVAPPFFGVMSMRFLLYKKACEY